MITAATSSSATSHALPSLSHVADRADQRLAEAAHDAERAHRQVERALMRGTSPDTLRERHWAGRTDPLVNRLSETARQLARQSMDLASNAGQSAKASLDRYADTTSDYIAQQPMRSVLIAAAVGAGLALLLVAGRKRL